MDIATSWTVLYVCNSGKNRLDIKMHQNPNRLLFYDVRVSYDRGVFHRCHKYLHMTFSSIEQELKIF